MFTCSVYNLCYCNFQEVFGAIEVEVITLTGGGITLTGDGVEVVLTPVAEWMMMVI